MNIKCRLSLLITAAALLSCGKAANTAQQYKTADTQTTKAHAPTPAAPGSYQVLATSPHKPAAFTQGWIMENGLFFESSGLYGHSYLVKYDINNNLLQKTNLPKTLFAEGLASNKEHLVLLTWKAQKALKIDLHSLELISEFPIKGEGWGLTHTGKHWVMSNGSNTLIYRDNHTFKEVKRIEVTGLGMDWRNINELEFAHGLIWANIWQTSLIIAIEPNTGAVKYQYDLSFLVANNTQRPWHESLNGIAYDTSQSAFWITGKHWRNRYLVQFRL